MKQISSISVLIFIVSLIFISCSDDMPENNPSLTPTESGRISKFYLEYLWEGVTSAGCEMQFELYQHDGTSIHKFVGKAKIAEDKTEIAINIPKEHKIKEGQYTVLGFINGKAIPTRLVVCFKDELVKYSKVCLVNYGEKLSGSGTKDDPYKIKNNADFNALCRLLNEDSETHGVGLFFSQTSNFSLDFQGSTVDDYGHANQSFAGTYLGNNHTISNLSHTGSAQSGYDENIGLFKQLHNGAVIEDLKIELGSCTGIYKNFGVVAAYAENATVEISNVTVKGTIYGNEQTSCQAGGVIGSVSNCILKVEGYTPGVTILNFNKHVGGVVGYAESSTITISKVYNSVGKDDRLSFRFVGNQYVGGLIGEAYLSTLSISSSSLNYTTSTGNNNMLISGSVGSIGGVIGQITSPNGDCSISDVSIYCPVGYVAEDAAYKGVSVGGIIGYLKSDKKITIKDCLMCGKVVGDKNVGGLVGELYASGSGLAIEGLFELAASEEVGIGIYGNENVGGLFGYVESSIISGCDKFESYANVSCNVVSGGGMIGCLKSTNISVGSTSFPSETLKVSGPQYVGGLVGSMTDNSTLAGDNSYNAFSSGGTISIPPKSTLKRNFIGTVEGNTSVGGAVGYINNGHLKNLHVSANIAGNGNNIGGVVGELIFSTDSTNFVRQCSFEGFVKNPNADRTGGIAGYVDYNGTIIDCINYGDINSEERGKHSGGIAGYVEYSDDSPAIRYCVNLGAVGGVYTAGGIVAHITGSASQWIYVHNCANYGHITCSSENTDDPDFWWGVGGIVGSCDHKRVQVGYCANHGKVDGLSGSGFHGIGGIAGMLGDDPTGTEVKDNLKVYSCANYGDVSCAGSGSVGGILGYQEEGDPGSSDHSSIVNDCSNHAVISDGGGIVGYVDHYSHIDRCVNFGVVSSGDPLIGEKKTAAKIHWCDLYYICGNGSSDWGSSFSESEKSSQSTYSGFDFSSTGPWRLDSGDAYPKLRKCTFESVVKPD